MRYRVIETRTDVNEYEVDAASIQRAGNMVDLDLVELVRHKLISRTLKVEELPDQENR